MYPAMHLLIDGYNLLHHVGLIHGQNIGPQKLEKARLSLLGQLRGRFAPEEATITVVFDARQAVKDLPPQMDHQGIQVFFTHSSEADDLIESFIQSSSAPQSMTVVSNDRRLREAARRRGCIVRSSEDFWEWLLQRPSRRAPAAEKPEQLTDDETKKWLEAFQDLDDSKEMKELNPYDFEFEDRD